MKRTNTRPTGHVIGTAIQDIAQHGKAGSPTTRTLSNAASIDLRKRWAATPWSVKRRRSIQAYIRRPGLGHDRRCELWNVFLQTAWGSMQPEIEATTATNLDPPLEEQYKA